MIFKKRTKYKMDYKMADHTLQKIFEACETAPNTIPFDKLVLRQKNNTKIYDCLLVLTGILLVCTFFLPLLITPSSNIFVKHIPHQTVTVVEDYAKDGYLYLTLSGDNIIFGESYLETADGTVQKAVSFDAETGIICFQYPNTESNIYIPVENAATLHLLLSPRK